MGVSEDVRNLFREFGGHAERYLEFGSANQTASVMPVPAPVASSAEPALSGVPGADGALAPASSAATPLPAGAGSLTSVFARLAGR